MQALDRVATPIVWSMTRARGILVVDRTCVLFGWYAGPLTGVPAQTDRAPL